MPLHPSCSDSDPTVIFMQLDALAAHIARRAAAGSPAAAGNTSQPATLQLAASRALLASVLAPASSRPVNLPQVSCN